MLKLVGENKTRNTTHSRTEYNPQTQTHKRIEETNNISNEIEDRSFVAQ
jgi:hypothetical protein